ncbi:hypothetical protein E0H73_01305 [Kribbella pittospori]|uniref:Lipoprotein n=1 Tax=Kribbella pittospori TaxID=722689 RepID=A0A4R0L0I7_9ACTN|nr:hypothetical protein [Kribbella pittospori]TCC65604.1 hypothetical protein E0H73_01305 [Kribbella pittospori]
MTRRPALGPAAAAICALLALTACEGSPEAGRPDSTPTSTSSTSTPTPTAPRWTPEEQAAITAAKARYAAATAAVDHALVNPATLDRSALEKAGIGGEWIITIIDQARSMTRSGWYQTGNTGITNTKVTSVKLDGEQPEVNLSNCLDSSKLVLRFKKDGKPVPLGPGNGRRHQFASRLVYAPPAPGGRSIWFLISDKDKGTC